MKLIGKALDDSDVYLRPEEVAAVIVGDKQQSIYVYLKHNNTTLVLKYHPATVKQLVNL